MVEIDRNHRQLSWETRRAADLGEAMLRSRVRIGLSQLLVMLVLAAGALVVAPTFVEPASAAPNGCTAVPDSGYGFNFKPSCDAHDICYENMPYGDSYSGRRTCDQVFRSNMLNHCSTRSSWAQRTVCRGVAYTYYYGVRAFGGFFFGTANAPLG